MNLSQLAPCFLMNSQRFLFLQLEDHILEKMYLCKKQVNNSYFEGIDETEDYTTVETLER